MLPEKESPNVLFNDAALMVVEKRAGISSIPERNQETPHLLALVEKTAGKKLFVVHRLDKGVSGIIVFAKNPESHRFLCRQFEHRTVTKEYRAIVHGLPVPASGSIHSPIRQFGSGRMGVDPERGKPSSTKYKVIEQGGGKSMLSVYPLTGRRHQIRVHLYSIGHPIVGDTLYGQRDSQQEFARLYLHAHRLEFKHPCGRQVSVLSPLPSDFHKELQG